MAITVNRLTKIISVLQMDLTHVVGTLYELDTDWFRLQLKAIEASEEGIIELDMHDHGTTYTVAGTTFARKVEVINNYSIEFTPNAMWSVRLAGSNNNLFDVENNILVQNQVQVIAQNSAGLIVTAGGGGSGTPAEVADAVWNELGTGHDIVNSYGKIVKDQTTSLQNHTNILNDLISFVKTGNVKINLIPASGVNSVRKVAIGALDRAVYEIKRDADLDWTSPVDIKTLYAWYSRIGDTDPIRMGENG